MTEATATAATETATTAAAATTTAAAATTTATAAASTATTAAPWFDGFKDPDLKGYVQTKGYPDAESLATAYRGAEKLLGAPADRIIRIPGKDAKPEDWNGVWGKLGRPEAPEGYKLPVPEGQDPAFAKEASKWFHEAGLPAGMAEKVVARWNEYQGKALESQKTAYNAQIEQENNQLRVDWGTAYDAKINGARASAKALGIDGATIDKLEQVMGFSGVMKFFDGLAAKVGETPFVNGNPTEGFKGPMTPDQARSRQADLRKDKEWFKKYMAGDAEARAEWKRLDMAIAGVSA